MVTYARGLGHDTFTVTCDHPPGTKRVSITKRRAYYKHPTCPMTKQGSNPGGV